MSARDQASMAISNEPNTPLSSYFDIGDKLAKVATYFPTGTWIVYTSLETWAINQGSTATDAETYGCGCSPNQKGALIVALCVCFLLAFGLSYVKKVIPGSMPPSSRLQVFNGMEKSPNELFDWQGTRQEWTELPWRKIVMFRSKTYYFDFSLEVQLHATLSVAAFAILSLFSSETSRCFWPNMSRWIPVAAQIGGLFICAVIAAFFIKDDAISLGVDFGYSRLAREESYRRKHPELFSGVQNNDRDLEKAYPPNNTFIVNKTGRNTNVIIQSRSQDPEQQGLLSQQRQSMDTIDGLQDIPEENMSMDLRSSPVRTEIRQGQRVKFESPTARFTSWKEPFNDDRRKSDRHIAIDMSPKKMTDFKRISPPMGSASPRPPAPVFNIPPAPSSLDSSMKDPRFSNNTMTTQQTEQQKRDSSYSPNSRQTFASSPRSRPMRKEPPSRFSSLTSDDVLSRSTFDKGKAPVNRDDEDLVVVKASIPSSKPLPPINLVEQDEKQSSAASTGSKQVQSPESQRQAPVARSTLPAQETIQHVPSNLSNSPNFSFSSGRSQDIIHVGDPKLVKPRATEIGIAISSSQTVHPLGILKHELVKDQGNVRNLDLDKSSGSRISSVVAAAANKAGFEQDIIVPSTSSANSVARPMSTAPTESELSMVSSSVNDEWRVNPISALQSWRKGQQ